MRNLHARIAPFFSTLPKACDLAVFDHAPCRLLCEESEKYTKNEWAATMRPYAASVLWLVMKLVVNGPEIAKNAYLKLSADRRALVRIGYAILFEDMYRFELGFTYRRPAMFFGADVKEGEFPVRVLSKMRLSTYLRLTEMGEVAA